MFGFFKKKRRRRLMEEPLPENLQQIITRNVPYVACLSADERRELNGLINVFLDEKIFEGCGGLRMTDEIRLTVAAQACILLLGREPDDLYPSLRSILVYPSMYHAPVAQHDPGGVMTQGLQMRQGESWGHGTVILSWDDVMHGASDIHDGRNLVFHEFAHQLDSEWPIGEGAPELPKRSMYIAWARVLGGEYATLIDDLQNHRPTLLDAYGATSPAEFFAVVTETFFEMPQELKDQHPELYEQLALFYRQDPASRSRC